MLIPEALCAVSFEAGKCVSRLFPKAVFGSLGFVQFRVNLRISSPVSAGKAHGIFSSHPLLVAGAWQAERVAG